MKKEELKEKKLQPEAKLTDEQLEQCNAGVAYDSLTNYQDTLGKAGGKTQQRYEEGGLK